jgi:enolase-phosphatase E1
MSDSNLSNPSEDEESDDSLNSESERKKKVRVFKPKVIILDFHGTVSPINWEEECILPYVKQNLSNYLDQNWTNHKVVDLVNKLRNQSFEQHFVFENEESPVISAEDPAESDDKTVKRTTVEFINWLIDKKKDTTESLKLQKLVWLEGYHKRELRTPVFEDVLPALKNFRDKGFKIAIFSGVDSSLCHQLFENTTEGDLSSYFGKFFDTTTGNKKDPESYRRIANELSVKESDILYITDYGQEAKIAHTTGVQCLLIIRPKNRRIREFYLITFSAIHSLNQIDFVERQQ